MSALEGLRVVELASVLAGPSVGVFLAELGADVIKVEDLGTLGDPTRRWRLAGESDRQGRSTYFSSVNFGKRSVAVRWREKAGLEVVRRLARQAEVVLASFRPGVDRQLGLDYPSLCAGNPRLIYGWVTGFGPEDPRGGYDALLQAETGWISMNGHPHGPPAKLPVALIDLAAGHQLKQGILLALLERERTGRGQLVEVSLFDAALTGLANQASNYLMEGQVPGPMGSEHPNLVPYGTFLPCQEGSLMLAVGSDRQFAALCRVLDCQELLERFASNPERVQGREALVEQLRTRASSWPVQALAEALSRAGVPAGQLADLAQLFDQPRAQRMVRREGPWACVRSTAWGQARPLGPPPGLGEHNEEVLGMDEIRALRREGAL